MINHRIGVIAAGLALATLTSPALSQGVAAPVTTAHPAQADTSVAEVVVTANKREERLEKVAIAVTVVGGAQLTSQTINEVSDLTRSVPSLNTAGPYGALSIRGVGSLSFARSAEGSVGVVVDGVALANTSTNPPELFDVARVEVLQGPQGTLFGRNSSAGVLSVVTNAPKYGVFEAIGHADIASRGDDAVRGAVNIPIADNAALRVSGTYSKTPEMQDNKYDGTSTFTTGESARARFKWDPTSNVTVNLIADYSDFIRKGGAPWSVYSSTPGSLLSSRLAGCGVVVGQQNIDGCIDGGNDTDSQSYGVSGQIDAHLGDLLLTSITSYRGFTASSHGSDADSVPINRLDLNASPTNIHNESEEIRLTSPEGKLVDYVVGLYYFHSGLHASNTQRGFLLADLGVPYPLGQTLRTTSSNTSLAAFGQATINVTSAFHLIAGARVGNERVHAVTLGSIPPATAAPFASIAGVNGRASDTYLSYHLGAQYEFTDKTMVYATYTRGYKGPSVNDQAGGGAVPVIVQPEVPHASELGLKTTQFDGRLVANLALFYNKVDNFQAQFFDPLIAQFVFGNAPSLTSKGVSLDLAANTVRGLTINAGAIYNDAKYGHGYNVACAQLETVAQGCQPITNAGGTVIGSVDDAGGNRLVGAPEWKVNLNGEYAHGIGGGLSSYIAGDAVYTSKINYDAANDPLDTNRPATIFGGRIGVRTDNGRLGVSIFARNLFDTYRSAVRFATPTAAQQLDPRSFSQISSPESRRIVGVSLDARL